MSNYYVELTQKLSKNLGKVRQGLPDLMHGFSTMSAAATKEGALDKKTKELVALGIAVSARCEGCIGFHVQTLVKLKVTEAELMETLGMAIYMGGGPSLMYAAEALQAFQEFSEA